MQDLSRQLQIDFFMNQVIQEITVGSHNYIEVPAWCVDEILDHIESKGFTIEKLSDGKVIKISWPEG